MNFNSKKVVNYLLVDFFDNYLTFNDYKNKLIKYIYSNNDLDTFCFIWMLTASPFSVSKLRPFYYIAWNSNDSFERDIQVLKNLSLIRKYINDEWIIIDKENYEKVMDLCYFQKWLIHCMTNLELCIESQDKVELQEIIKQLYVDCKQWSIYLQSKLKKTYSINNNFFNIDSSIKEKYRNMFKENFNNLELLKIKII